MPPKKVYRRKKPPLTEPHTYDKALICQNFVGGFYIENEDGSFTPTTEDNEDATYRGQCLRCAAVGTLYTCVVTVEGDINSFGRNATTAGQHLFRKHNISCENPQASSAPRTGVCHNPPTQNDLHHFLKCCTEHGLGYNIFTDSRFTNYLRMPVSATHVRKETTEAAKVTLRNMGNIIRATPGQVSIIFDLGTIDRIQTCNVLINHPSLATSFLILSEPLTNSGADFLVLVIKKSIRNFRKYCPDYPIAAIVCDNGPNVLAACAKLRAQKTKPGGEAYNTILHFNCACHVLNLVSHDVDKALTKELKMEGVDKVLLTEGLINRIVPTRWWCKMKEYLKVIHSEARQSKLLRVKGGQKIFENMVTYAQRCARLHQLARILERDDSTCAVAVTALLELINCDDATIQLATLNRYLKWYAGSEVPLLVAVLSGPTLPSLGYLRKNPNFKALLTGIMNTLVTAPFENVDIDADLSEAWSKWFNGDHVAFNNGPLLWRHHWLDTEPAFEALRKLHEKLQFVISSESAAERSLSRQSIIRNQRFRLGPQRCQDELQLAFNQLPSEMPPVVPPKQTAATASKPPVRDTLNMSLDTPPASDDEEKTSSPVAKKNRVETVEVSAAKEELSSATVRALNAHLGQQVIMLWYWHASEWSKFREGQAIVYLGAKPTQNATRIFVPGEITKVNRKGYKIYISQREGQVIQMDVATAFLRLVQRLGARDKLDWPNVAYSVKVAKDNANVGVAVDSDEDSEEDNDKSLNFGFKEAEAEPEVIAEPTLSQTATEPSETQGPEPSTTQVPEPSATQGPEPSTTQGLEPHIL